MWKNELLSNHLALIWQGTMVWQNRYNKTEYASMTKKQPNFSLDLGSYTKNK